MKFPLGTLFFFITIAILSGCSSGTKIITPGVTAQNKTLLSNGWSLSPAGKQIAVGDLPLNIAVSPDGKYAVTTNNGASKPTLSVINLTSLKVEQTVNIPNSWLGIKFSGDRKILYVSGANESKVFIYSFSEAMLTLQDSIVIGEKWPKNKIWLGGLDVDESLNRLYVTGKQNANIYVVDLSSKKVLEEIRLPSQPYTCLSSVKKDYVYVTLWGSGEVALLNKNSLKIDKTITCGSHPSDIIESKDGAYLFVANANENYVSVIDIEKAKEIEKLNSALTPDAPPGSTPDALCLNQDGSKLYIANADNNSLAVMNVSNPGKSFSLGFIPTGWYPTSVKMIPGENKMLVVNGKGDRSFPNPHGPNPNIRDEGYEYIGTLLKGSVSVIEEPGAEQLTAYSKEVYDNTPLVNKSNYDKWEETNPIVKDLGKTSPIKHVFYIIRENRTYDQVFGDIKEGNGDPALCIFPEKITPNAHALVHQFVLLDNFYCDAEVSANGHNWSNAAYATDYVEKSWPNYYGGRGGNYEFEGGYPIAYPYNGFMWDNCKRNNVSYRSYGEFTHNGKTPEDTVTAAIESLVGHVSPFYRGWDLDYSDTNRVNSWMKEFDQYEKNGNLPAFQVLRLPNDHTYGTASNRLTPNACVAQNDLALGMMIERITKSPYWKESAVFVIEDDAQNGSDHVDAHRSVALVISPYTKHNFVDHEMYSTSSMIRTMELILGLPPMSQYDASATPMFNTFTSALDLTPFNHLPANVNLDEKNKNKAYGQERSDQMNFTREDATPEIELNEIIWKSVKGEDSQMPAPVRSAFISKVSEEDDDD